MGLDDDPFEHRITKPGLVQISREVPPVMGFTLLTHAAISAVIIAVRHA